MRIDEELFVALLDDISNHGLIGSDSIKAEAEVDDTTIEFSNNMIHIADETKGICFHVRMLDKDQQSDIELAIKECLEEFSYALAISTLGAQKVASRSAAPNY
tara:strand:- start:1373 stop:1681 length:309 start_codon:yes stop_codon:yes gene_type:complete